MLVLEDLMRYIHIARAGEIVENPKVEIEESMVEYK